MRRSREDAAETRRKIVAAASRLFRGRGIAAVSVADVMGALGLTVGGFYRHFESKDALVSEAVDAASIETTTRHASVAPDAPAVERLGMLLDAYLSRAHRDRPEAGCPVAALCSEVAHETRSTKKAFTRALERMLVGLAAVLPGESAAARDLRLQTVSSLVGAVVLARATSDPKLGGEILDAVRRGLR
jgi:TetR/AcrR family transcriptional repressor of nem operon